MPPAHFAITEVLIVFTSIYSVYLLKNRRDFFALIGIILIGLAATLGAIRFGLSSGETIIKLNTILGIYSGLTCIGLISVQMAYNLQWKHIYKLLLVILTISLIVSILWPKQFIFYLILIWSLISILIVMDYPNTNIIQKIYRGIAMSILLIGFLTVRKNGLLSDLLTPSVSFHLYHIIIAVWIYSVTQLIKKPHI
jgi:hypothetical protein